MIILLIIIPLIFIVWGLSLLANGVESTSKTTRDMRLEKIQREYLKTHPNCTRDEMLQYLLRLKREGKV